MSSRTFSAVALLTLCLSFTVLTAKPSSPPGHNSLPPTITHHDHKIHPVDPFASALDIGPSYVELRSGMHFQAQDGRLHPAQGIFELNEKGRAVAANRRHPLTIHPNPARSGAVEIHLQKDLSLKSHVLGIALYDPVTDKSLLIDKPKPVNGTLLLPDRRQVLFQNAFAELGADLLYEIGPGHFAQDVVLHHAIDVHSYGFDPETVHVEVWTEFLNPPDPKVKRHARPHPVHQYALSEDYTLSFESLVIGPGRFYRLHREEAVNATERRTGGLPVRKEWVTDNGRTFLVESVPFEELAPMTDGLPQRANPQRARQQSSAGRFFPSPPAWNLEEATHTRLLAAATSSFRSGGAVLDYVATSSTDSYTFASGTTYYVSDPVYLTGDTVFEGGATLKFADSSSAYLLFYDPPHFQTDLYNPVVFTSVHDDSVGEILPFSNHTPAMTLPGRPYIYMMADGDSLAHCRFRYAGRGIYYYDSTSDHTIRHSQFFQCDTGIQANGNSYHSLINVVAGENLLFEQVRYPLDGHHFRAHLSHATARAADQFSAPTSASSELFFQSCILSGFQNTGPATVMNADHLYFFASTDAPFQPAGFGSAYLGPEARGLAAGSVLSTELSEDFQQCTTHAPLHLSGSQVEKISLSKAVPRAGAPPYSPGYHYPAIDYLLLDRWELVGADITLSHGSVLALGPHGSACLQQGASLRSVGTPDSPVRWISTETVQEQPVDRSRAGVHILADAATGVPQVEARFTTFQTLSSQVNHFNIDSSVSGRLLSLSLRDCAFTGGGVLLHSDSTSPFSAGIFNCLWNGTLLQVTGHGEATVCNNLFRANLVLLQREGSSFWSFFDNVFDRATPYDWADSVVHGHNAYHQAGYRLLPTQPTDQVLSHIKWFSGPFGLHYQSSASTLLDAGSRPASAAGLFSYTTVASATPEGHSTVDIGFHYPATSNGLPLDTDQDGIPDYVEDENGDGSWNQLETDWQLADTDYDGRTDSEERADETDPLDFNSARKTRLTTWQLDTPDWKSDHGHLPQSSSNVQPAPSWSGLGARIFHSDPANLKYRHVEPDAHANVNLRQGTVQFWFKPSWSSSTLGGSGPGSYARLLESGRWSSSSSYGWWGLHLNPSGNELHFSTQADGTWSGTLLKASIQWTQEEWHHVALTYSPSFSALYLDGQLADTGSGISLIPNAGVRAVDGFNIGSNFRGTEQSRGLLDEITSFNYPLSAEEVSAAYHQGASLDSDADGLTNLQENTLNLNPLLADTDGDSMSDKWEVDHQLNPNGYDPSEDLDGDGINNLSDVAPNDSSLGALQISIDFPVSGSSI